MLVRSTIAVGCRWFAALVLIVAVCADQAGAGPVDGVCAALARQAERAEGIPPGLVEAVALAESGRWLADEGTTRPWPWTVTSGTDSFFFASKREALRKVQELRSQGRSNIDVGCMQINLGYHGHAFDSVAEALEPAVNVAYGAQFLRQLREETQLLVAGDRPLPLAQSEARPSLSRKGVSASGNRCAACAWPTMRRPVWSADRGVADAAPPALAPASGPRLIVPGRAAADRQVCAGGIPILRGGITSLRDG